MLKVVIVVVLLLVVAVVAAVYLVFPSTQDERSTIVGPYRNTTEGFSIVIPNGWIGELNEEDSPLLFLEGWEEDTPVFGEVRVFPLQDDTPAEDWLSWQIADYEPDIVLSSEPRPFPGADSGHRSTMSTRQENGDVMIETWTAVARGSQMFLLRAMAKEQSWPADKTIGNSFVDNFYLETPLPFGVSRDNSLFLYWGEVMNFDPANSRRGAGDIVGAIFSGLVKLDTDLKVVPDIAATWEVSDNGTVFTFNLKDDVRFHDGRAVTAGDFKYSWERALHPATGSAVASTYLGDIVGADAVMNGEAESLAGVEVLDERTLRVAIEARLSYFLAKLAYPTSFVVDRANVETGDDWTDASNGTGAFKLKTWQKDQLLILERNEDWYDGPPALANVVYRIFAGNPMRMYENGEIDLVPVYANNIDRARDPTNHLNKGLIEGTTFCTTFLGFNVTQPPFDDRVVRKSLALAMEVDKQLEVTQKGLARRAAGFVPPGMFGYNSALEPSGFDSETARETLRNSRYGGPEGLPPITSFANDHTIHWAWREHLGVEVEAVSVFEGADRLDRLDNREFGVFTWGWCADYPDPQNFLDVLFHSESAENRFAYANEQVDLLLDEAAVELDPARRANLYQQAERIVLNDWVAVPLQHSNTYLLVRPYVKGFEVTPIRAPQLQNISIERGR